MPQAVKQSKARSQPKHRFSRVTGALIGKSNGLIRIPREFGSAGAYAMHGEGTCMAPIIDDGDTVVCDPSRVPKEFDLVAIFLTNGKCLLKRLRHAIPARGARDWDSPLNTHLVCESDAPDRMYRIPRDHVLRVHVVTYNVTQQKGLLDLPYDREYISFPVIGEIGEKDIRPVSP